MKFTHGNKCSAAWGGHGAEHCTACHMTFSSTKAGDAHRVGNHGVVTGGSNPRRCLTRAEMEAKTVKSGKLEGEPYFAVTVNAYGTEIWRVNQGEKAAWFKSGEDSKSLTGVPTTDYPPMDFRALESTPERVAA